MNWNNKADVLEKIKEDTYNLKFASEELQNDKEVVLLAVSIRGFDIRFASKELQNDKEVVLMAVSNYGWALQYASKQLQNDKEVVNTAIANNPDAIQFAYPIIDKTEINKVATLPPNKERSKTMQLTKARQAVQDFVLEALREEKFPFQSFIVKGESPYNASSNNSYHGINRLILSYYLIENELKDPRFMTFKQATDQGYKIKKGSKGVPVEFSSFYDLQTKKLLTYKEANALSITVPKRVQFIRKNTTVFHATCIDGITPYIPEEMASLEQDSLAEEVLLTYLDNEGIKLTQSRDVQTPCYIPAQDCIKMPPISDAYEYLSILAHEIGHSTGHEKRLNRELQVEDKKKYAIEELYAECASAFLSSDLRIQSSEVNKTNHKAYLQSWLQIIEDKPAVLFEAISKATGIADYVLEHGEYKRIFEKDKSQTLDFCLERK